MEQESYILGRGFSANARLNLQYFLWKHSGFSLHPNIESRAENLRVAEIGVGTGIWLVDLAAFLPASAHIDGFDIDLTQCPPKEWLPSNVAVHNLDCLAPLPDHVIGLTFEGEEFQLTSPAEPGGWISWGEIDYSCFKVVRTEEGKNVEDNMTALLRMIGTLGGTRPDWTADDWPLRLPQFFQDNGLVNVAVDNRPFPLELLPFQLDTALMASDEVSYKALDAIGNGSGDRCRELISKVFETRQQLAYNVGRMTVIAQRPFLWG